MNIKVMGAFEEYKVTEDKEYSVYGEVGVGLFKNYIIKNDNEELVEVNYFHAEECEEVVEAEPSLKEKLLDLYSTVEHVENDLMSGIEYAPSEHDITITVGAKAVNLGINADLSTELKELLINLINQEK
ncbi:hypothetical protein D3C81_08530 [compost metagenome]